MSCSSDKSEEATAEKGNAENVQQESSDLSNNIPEGVQQQS
jgi:hypothetical protein